MSMQGVCAKCGFVFLLDYGLECPACILAARTENVRKAFAPIDPLRTALGIGSKQDIREHYEREAAAAFHWHGEDMRGTIYEDKESTEVPAGCRIPKGEQAQVYELKRRFRL